jgi:hypothetical protein
MMTGHSLTAEAAKTMVMADGAPAARKDEARASAGPAKAADQLK